MAAKKRYKPPETRTLPPKTCGKCYAGIKFNEATLQISTCRTCRLFEEDSDAAGAVELLLQTLHGIYRIRPDDTVADSFDRITDAVTEANRQAALIKKPIRRAQ